MSYLWIGSLPTLFFYNTVYFIPAARLQQSNNESSVKAATSVSTGLCVFLSFAKARLKKKVFIYFFLAVLGLRCCSENRSYSQLVVVRAFCGAPLVVEPGL